MLTIRLFRVGKKKQPAFKIVVTDKHNAAARGRFVEEVGFYNPLTKQRNLKGDRVKYWMSVGAQPSATVHNMLVADNVIESKKVAKHKKIAPKAEETPADVSSDASTESAKTAEKEEAPAPETPAEAAPEQSAEETEKPQNS